MSRNTNAVHWLPVSFNTSGNQTIVAGVSNQQIRVWAVILSSASSVGLTFLNGAIPLSGTPPLTQIALDLDEKPFICSPGSSFVISSNGNVDVEGSIAYTQG